MPLSRPQFKPFFWVILPIQIFLLNISANAQNSIRWKTDLFGTGSSAFTGNTNFIEYERLPNNSTYVYESFTNITPDATTNGYFVPFDLEAERIWVAASDLTPGQRITMNTVQSVSPTANFSVIPEAEAGRSYTFRMRILGLSATKGIVMKTQKRPTNFVSVSNSAVNNEVPAGTAVTVTATLDQVRGTDEFFFLKYSTEPENTSFRTFTYLPLQFSDPNDLTGEATIPAPAVSGKVFYYLVSSTFNIPQELADPNFTDGDLLNLRSVPNNNTLLQYTVKPGVVFRVQTNNLSGGASQVFLAGSFNGFNPTALPMKDMGNSTWMAELNLPAGTAVTYKFLNGSTWENVPSACGVDDGSGNLNRTFTPQAIADTTNLVCFGTCSSCVGAPQNITFRVNMTGQTVASQGVYVQGNFNDFSATASPMTSVGNGIYELTVPIVFSANTPIQFRFVNGVSPETVPAACSVSVSGSPYRQAPPSGQATTLPLVCFSACNNVCGESAMRFRVNMTNQTISPFGVYLAGTFNNFSTTATPMTAIGGNVYEATVSITRGDTVYYKFVNGTNFELVPEACGINDGGGNLNRRAVAANQASTTLSTVCFGKCDNNCPPLQFFNVSFQVSTVGQTISPQGVFLVGNFNNFVPLQMQNPTGNFYTLTVSVPNDRPLRYRFVNGSSPEGLPTACGVNVNGSLYRETSAPQANQFLSTVCFGRCDNICVALPYRSITFRVNMTGLSISPFGMSIALKSGSNTLPSLPLTDVGNNVYELVYSLPQNLSFQYRFVNGLSSETVPAACGTLESGTYYRTITIGTSNQVLPTVCYGTCNNNCGPVSNVNLTFRVRMTGQTISPEGVKLAGSFNGFSPTANSMTNTGNDVYEATVVVPAGSTQTYKFINGSTWETVPASCGLDDGAGNINRSTTVPNQASSLPIVCFGKCLDDCSQTSTVSVTFRVNMTNQTISAQGVKLAGSFNGFSTTANPMTSIGNNLYETTLQLAAGTYTYKFVNGSTFEEGLTTCGVGSTFDRQLTVTNAAQTVPTVCFGRCDNNCPLPIFTGLFKVNMTGQTVSPLGMKLVASFNNFQPIAMTLSSGSVYEVSDSIPPNAGFGYAFMNGTVLESVPLACGTAIGNTVYRNGAAGNTSTEFPQVCFSACDLACTTVSIQNEGTSPAFQVFPNPSDGNLRLVGLLPTETVQIFNASGQHLPSGSLEHHGEGGLMLQLHHLPAGLYLLKAGKQSARFTIRK